jgi:hypothetical protein
LKKTLIPDLSEEPHPKCADPDSDQTGANPKNGAYTGKPDPQSSYRHRIPVQEAKKGFMLFEQPADPGFRPQGQNQALDPTRKKRLLISSILFRLSSNAAPTVAHLTPRRLMMFKTIDNSPVIIFNIFRFSRNEPKAVIDS